MNRVGFLLKVKKEYLTEYRDHHKGVWEDMKRALHRQGWYNYSIFMKDDGFIFGYFETTGTFAEALYGMEQEPINSKWQEFMAPFIEIPEGAMPDAMMIELEEVFHLE
tara:strand:- start:53 stop:376 length:324 start_codon:yes stop_codon:yes gene_type:complete